MHKHNYFKYKISKNYARGLAKRLLKEKPNIKLEVERHNALAEQINFINQTRYSFEYILI